MTILDIIVGVLCLLLVVLVVLAVHAISVSLEEDLDD